MESNHEQHETSVSLLNHNSIHTPESKTIKTNRQRCIVCVAVATGIIVIVLLAVAAFLCFAEFTRSIRCSLSETLSFHLTECASEDVLKSFSNLPADISWDDYEKLNKSLCNGQHACEITRTLTKQDLEYIAKADSAWETAWEILHDNKGWKLKTGSSLETGRVYTKSYQGIGTVNKLQGYIDASPERVFKRIVVETENLASWNPSIKSFQVVYTITDNVDVIYVETNPTAGGLISARDFVNLRHWKTRNDATLCCEVATTHPDKPPPDDFVRVEQKPGGTLIRPIKGQPNKCILEKALSADIGGWIPQWLVDDQVATTMMDFLQDLRSVVQQ